MERREHPLLGEIRYSEDEDDVQGWVGAMTLPGFAACGRPILDDILDSDPEGGKEEAYFFERGQFTVFIHDQDRKGPSREQDRALKYLVENEAEVCRLVLEDLYTAVFEEDDENKEDEKPDVTALQPVALLRDVEVAEEWMGDGYPDGQAYLGFIFSFGVYEECPTCVVFHPVEGTWWAEASLDEAIALGLEAEDEDGDE